MWMLAVAKSSNSLVRWALYCKHMYAQFVPSFAWSVEPCTLNDLDYHFPCGAFCWRAMHHWTSRKQCTVDRASMCIVLTHTHRPLESMAVKVSADDCLVTDTKDELQVTSFWFVCFFGDELSPLPLSRSGRWARGRVGYHSCRHNKVSEMICATLHGMFKREVY